MFVRKKKNRSGSVSIVVVDKSRGRFREVRQFGVAHTEAEADALYTQAREWIRRYAGQQTIDFGGGAVASENDVDMLVSRIDGVSINGTQLLLNRIYDSVGFNRIKDDVLRHLVVARISQPSSKLATTSYLRSYFKEDIDLSRIYRYMDKLYNSQMELERAIRHAGIAISVDKVLDIAKTIITIDVRTDGVRGVSMRTLFLTEEQKAIKQLFEMDTTKAD